ncbi:hypothetical protein [Paraburkholderia tropica]|uniref:hypothetical protein n=1 Tax=Paraburkholderia tropica TaxID=92647 RepID=UPI003D2CE7CB
MSDVYLDEDGYPTDVALKRIEEWPHADISGMLDFILSIWWCPHLLWDIEGVKLHASTGGWSGNESLIRAMQNNRPFWATCWEQSRRGGHFIFDLTRVKKLAEKEEA